MSQIDSLPTSCHSLVLSSLRGILAISRMLSNVPPEMIPLILNHEVDRVMVASGCFACSLPSAR